MAGKRKGKEDERHLWPEMLRAIREIQPRWVVGENVFGLINWSGGLVFHEVQTDLEAAGYEVWPYVLPACAVNAPHRRDRVWFVAHSKSANAVGSGRISNSKRESGTEIRGGLRNEFSGSGTNGATPNPTGCSAGSPGKGGKTKGNRSNNNNEPKSGGIEAELNNGCGSVLRTITDPTGEGRKEREQTGGRENAEENGTGLVDGVKRFIYNGDAADTGNQGLQGGEINGSSGRFGENGNKQFAGCVPPNWQVFPTQSPICSGNDGVSTRLDGITFSKWRNESIKAAGNAIVPQVVYQIFKAIEQYELCQGQ